MSQPKVCKDCKYSVPDRFFIFPMWEFAKCTHPSAYRSFDVVTGKVESYFCSTERKWGCGFQAINFVARHAKKELA